MTRIESTIVLCFSQKRKIRKAIRPESANNAQPFADLQEKNKLRTHLTKTNSMKDITYEVIGCAYEVYNALGPGLLEKIYQKALAIELQKQGFRVEKEVPVQIRYKGESIGEDLKIDLLINGSLILELKSVERVTDLHKKQLLTYLRLLHQPIGLLINFNEAHLKDGIVRVVNNYQEDNA